MPVMEGKCVLFKTFGGVDAISLCIRSKDIDENAHTISLLLGSFGGINLEDIAAPRCFEIERKLKEISDIPIADITVVTSGAGAAGIAIIKLLIARGLHPAKVIMTDRKGAIYEGLEGLNPEKEEIAKNTNTEKKARKLADIIKGADVFIGVSAPGTLTQDMVRSMAKDSIIFPMANPVPEIMPNLALEAGAAVVGTGRSDFPNQINNVLAFPGIFRGALDVRAKDINNEMSIAAANANASLVSDNELNKDYILPKAFDPRVKDAVSTAVAKASRDSGVARI
ncbi:hypothetical protein M9Y10_003699 [Tritrichomonas musculus]|uniref:Uncharacterized protein n=1 Tax=Tritrichomonas musculus TaxID=1915356 RepID=A0ABR2JQF1_9EUKA